MSATRVRNQVKDFKEQYACGEAPEDAFAPWYLTKAFGLSPIEAIRLSAEGKTGLRGPGFDFGIDAFTLIREDGKPPILVVIQAKFSESLDYLTRGVRDLKKSLQWIKFALKSSEAEFPRENKVLVNLRAELGRIGDEQRSAIKLEFVVIHLSEDDPDIIANRTRAAQEELREEFRFAFPDLISKIKIVGPREIENLPPPENLPSPSLELRFEGTSLEVSGSGEAVMFLGIGRLSELVDLYRSRKDDLFSKNVRLFLTSRKNIEKGPSGKIRESLRRICLDKKTEFVPELFALYHNGVTIQARDIHAADGKLSFRDPYVLNGCQTIVTANAFRFGQRTSAQVDIPSWNRILIPVRVVGTRDEGLVRAITVSNNRQNDMTASALRANDPIQIELEHRFAEAGIFYERQEGAFDFLEDTDAQRIARVYKNSSWGPIEIEDIGRCLAAAAGEISIAKNTNDLFESDAAYSRCFSSKRVSSIHFMVFLQNLHNVLGVVLKNDLGLDWSASYVKSGKITFYVLCLLCRYFVKKNDLRAVEDYGEAIVGRDRTLRDEIAKQLGNRCSGIKGEIQGRFMALEDTHTESLNDAYRKIERSLRLGSEIDVFAAVADFDRRFD